MARISPLDPAQAEGKAKDMLDQVQAKMGRTPNILKTMARAPAVLEAYLGFSAALGEGALSPELRERIALAVGQANDCGYCVAAHSAIGKMAAGLDDDAVADSRRGKAPDAKTQAALDFALRMVEKRGFVSDDEVESLKTAGYDEAEILEITANVAINFFTNYFNHVAGTDVDFPKVPDLD